MILVTTVAMMILTMVTVYQLKTSIETQMQNDGRTLVSTIRREISQYDTTSQLEEIQAIFAEVKRESEGNISYISLSNNSSKIIVSDTFKVDGGSGDADAVSSASEGEDVASVVQTSEIMGSMVELSDATKVYNVSAPYYYDSKLSGVVNVGISLEAMNLQIKDTITLMVIIVLILLAITSVVTILIARSLAKPIIYIANELEDFSKGDFTIQLKNKGKDEIYQLTASLNSAIAKLRITIGTVKVVVEKLYDIATNLTASGQEVSASMEQLSQGVGVVVDDITDENVHISSIHKVLEDYGVQLDRVHRQTLSVKTNNQSISKTADKSKNQLEAMIESFDDVRVSFVSATKDIISLNDDIGKVNAITEVINSVAAQTNLLALNAAIESARAGEAGKGFAVVADEIRKLAEQVVKSANSINQIVSDITINAKTVVTDTSRIAEKMEHQKVIIEQTSASLGSIQTEVADVISEMDLVSHSIECLVTDKEVIIKNIGNIAHLSEDISGSSIEIVASIQNQSANLQQLSLLAQDVNVMADKLMQDVEVFKIE